MSTIKTWYTITTTEADPDLDAKAIFRMRAEGCRFAVRLDENLSWACFRTADELTRYIDDACLNKQQMERVTVLEVA